MKLFFLIILWLFWLDAWFLRTLEWAGFVQEKEYRFDRIRASFAHRYIWKRLLNLAPYPKNFDLKYLKRPKFTKRILATLSIVFFINSIFLFYFFSLKTALLILITQPFLLMLVAGGTSILKELYTDFLLYLLQNKLKDKNPLIIGITGSYGKTATKHLLTYILKFAEKNVITTPKSVNTPLAVAKYLLKNYSDQDYIVLEYAAYRKGEIQRLALSAKPSIAIVIGVTYQHASLFGSLEKVIEAKSELASNLKEDGVIFYPDDDPSVAKIVAEASESVVRQPLNSFEYSFVKIDQGKLVMKFDDVLIKTQLIGQQYCLNTALSLRVAEYLGIAQNIARQAVESFVPQENFINIYQNKHIFLIDNSGTSNPVGFKSAIELLRSMQKSEQKAVLIAGGIPDLGEYSSRSHQEISKLAREVFDFCLYTNEVAIDDFRLFFPDLIVDKEEIISLIEQILDNNSPYIVLLEGRVPGWLAKHIDKLKDDA